MPFSLVARLVPLKISTAHLSLSGDHLCSSYCAGLKCPRSPCDPGRVVKCDIELKNIGSCCTPHRFSSTDLYSRDLVCHKIPHPLTQAWMFTPRMRSKIMKWTHRAFELFFEVLNVFQLRLDSNDVEVIIYGAPGDPIASRTTF